MGKRITSILLILMFSGIMSAPLFHGDNCDMVCCSVESESPIMLQLKEECIATMTECHPSIFIPVLNGPGSVFTLETDIDSELNDFERVRSFEKEWFIHREKLNSGHPPPHHNLPLLI